MKQTENRQESQKKEKPEPEHPSLLNVKTSIKSGPGSGDPAWG